MQFKTFVRNFSFQTKSLIESLQTFKDLNGEEKKQRLDSTMTEWANTVIDSVSLNPIFKWVIKKLLIENIPVITQAIFDLIQTRVKGITEAV